MQNPTQNPTQTFQSHSHSLAMPKPFPFPDLRLRSVWGGWVWGGDGAVMVSWRIFQDFRKAWGLQLTCSPPFFSLLL